MKRYRREFEPRSSQVQLELRKRSLQVLCFLAALLPSTKAETPDASLLHELTALKFIDTAFARAAGEQNQQLISRTLQMFNIPSNSTTISLINNLVSAKHLYTKRKVLDMLSQHIDYDQFMSRLDRLNAYRMLPELQNPKIRASILEWYKNNPAWTQRGDVVFIWPEEGGSQGLVAEGILGMTEKAVEDTLVANKFKKKGIQKDMVRGEVWAFPKDMLGMIGTMGFRQLTRNDRTIDSLEYANKLKQLPEKLRTTAMKRAMGNEWVSNAWVKTESGFRLQESAFKVLMELAQELAKLGIHFGISSTDDKGHSTKEHYFGKIADIRLSWIRRVSIENKGTIIETVVFIPIEKHEAAEIMKTIKTILERRFEVRLEIGLGKDIIDEYHMDTANKDGDHTHLDLTKILTKFLENSRLQFAKNQQTPKDSIKALPQQQKTFASLTNKYFKWDDPRSSTPFYHPPKRLPANKKPVPKT